MAWIGLCRRQGFVWGGWVLAAIQLVAARGAEPVLIASPDAFQTLVNPDCSHCVDESRARAADLRDDDPVLAWVRGKYEGGAIPIRFFLNPFRVISDTYGVFVFDPDAGFSRGYEPSLEFSFYGWRNGIMVMRHKDGTLFSTLSGRAFDGPRRGEQLTPVATLRTQWGPWASAYPGSVAYRMFDKYQALELPEGPIGDSKQTRGKADPRLAEEAEVLGVSLGGVQKAYPLDSLPEEGGVVRDVLADQEIVILWQASTRTAVAYATRFDGDDGGQLDQLSFAANNPAAPFLDPETGTHFDIAGRAVSGPRKGQTLRWIDSVQCRWYAWAAEYPQTELHAGAAAPPKRAEGDARTAAPPQPPPRQPVPPQPVPEMLLVGASDVTPEALVGWKADGFSSVVLPLDENQAAETLRLAVRAIAASQLELYYWIEVARSPLLADAHPRWMASLGVHDDWLLRFPQAAKPLPGQVAKAYPWVPIGYADAFQAHLDRVVRLVQAAPQQYRGLLLNDLQGGPASCGCGNGRCRWAIDYGVPETAAKQGVDDAAARFLAAIAGRIPGKQVIPIWMTECERGDLPADQAPGGKSTGLCGSVACAKGLCPQAFARQWGALASAHQGPLGIWVTDPESGRDADSSVEPIGRIAASVAYLADTQLPAPKQAPTMDRLWLVVSSASTDLAAERVIRRTALAFQPGAVIVARIAIEQSYEPRNLSVARAVR